MKPLIILDEVAEFYKNSLGLKNKKRISPKEYNSKFSKFLYRKYFPIFLDRNAYHENDLENISQTCKVRRINKKDLSVVVLDEHTDMYIFDEDKIEEVKRITGRDLENEINLGNWVLELIKQGSPDISLVGVRDFTRQAKRSLYSKYNDKIDFYLGPNFNSEKHFDSEDFRKTKLQKLEDFFNKNNFKPYTFIRLDCDVSQDLLGPADSNIRKCGDLKYDEVIDAINYVQKNSEIIGLSIFGEGFMFGSFTTAADNIKKIISNFYK